MRCSVCTLGQSQIIIFIKKQNQTNKNNSEAQRGRKYLVNLIKTARAGEGSELRTHCNEPVAPVRAEVTLRDEGGQTLTARTQEDV